MSNKLKLIVASILLLVSGAVARAEDPEANQYPIQHPVISSHADHVAGSLSFLANRRLDWEERLTGDPVDERSPPRADHAATHIRFLRNAADSAAGPAALWTPVRPRAIGRRAAAVQIEQPAALTSHSSCPAKRR